MKKIIALLLATILLLSLAACTDSASEDSSESEDSSTNAADSGSDSKGSIKVGLSTSLSGNTANNGEDARDAIELYLKNHDNKLGGFEVELYIEDDACDAATAVTKFQKLVEVYDVDVILGPSNTACANATIGYCDENEVPVFMASNSGDDITQINVSPYGIRVGVSSSFTMHPMADYAYNDLELRSVAMLGYDFAYGYEIAGGFQHVFEDLGGTITQKVFVPSGTNDFAPYLTSLDLSSVDCLFVNLSGADATRCAKQLVEYGIVGSGITIIAGYTTCDESILNEFDSSCVDFYTANTWTPALENEENVAFVEAFETAYGRTPGMYAEQHYAAIVALDKALENVDDLSDGAVIVEAAKSTEITGLPNGSLTFDEFGQAIQSVFIRKTELRDGKLVNVPVKEYEGVSQFWTWSPEEYLEMPRYTKDYRS